jgi:acetylglutamate kinase
MKTDPTLEQIAELMNELDAYQHRTVVIKIGGNSIDEDEHFLTKIAKQIKFLRANGVRVILIHGGGPQIAQAMRVVQKVMKDINLQVVQALVDAGIRKDKILAAAKHTKYFVHAEPLDKKDGGLHNRSGKPKSVTENEIEKVLEQGKVIVMHSVAIGSDGKTVYNVNGDDYAMAVAIAIAAKRLILVTNVSGVFDKQRKRIPAIDQEMATEMIGDGTIHGGMVPKVESALWVVKQGVGGVAIIDGFKPWSILAEMLTHEGFGTLFQARLG